MGRHSNLTLVREDGVIIDAIRHVNSEMSRVRTVQPGGVYQLPPSRTSWPRKTSRRTP